VPWKPYKSDRAWCAHIPIPVGPFRKSIYGVPPHRAEIPGTIAPRPFADVPRAEIDRAIEERRAYELALMQGLVVEPPTG